MAIVNGYFRGKPSAKATVVPEVEPVSDAVAAVPTSMVGRVAAVLRAFDGASDELSLSELSTRSGLPKSTTHRLAEQLVSEGILERGSTRYRLGLLLFELGSLVPTPRRLGEIAGPYIESLYEATGQTVHFGVLDGTDVLYVQRVVGHRSLSAPTRLGGRMPAYCTGLGKAMLAFSRNPRHLEDVIEAGLVSLTPNTITSPRALRDELTRTFTRGVAYDREEQSLGIACAAAPVLNRGGDPVAAISATTVPQALDIVAPAVRATALNLSRAIHKLPSSYWRQTAPLERL